MHGIVNRPVVSLDEESGGDGADDATDEVDGAGGGRVVHRLLLLQDLHGGKRQQTAASEVQS